MAHGDFVWCDLSSYRTEQSLAFYRHLLGWHYQETRQPDGTAYHLAFIGKHRVAGLFAMPDKFRQIQLPAFWMSYIAVDRIEESLSIARKMGGKVELGPVDIGENTQVALIRDPLGAGFTITEGPMFEASATPLMAGYRSGHDLYVSDAQAIIPFYEALFGWKITASERAMSVVRHADGRTISRMYTLPDAERGRHEFWGVRFAVDDLSAARTALLAEGGSIDHEEPGLILAREPDGAAFFLEGVPANAQNGTEHSASSLSGWKTLLALVVIWVCVVLNINTIWAAFLLWWTFLGLKNGETFLVETISQQDHPILFGLIMTSWIILSALLVASDIWR